VESKTRAVRIQLFTARYSTEYHIELSISSSTRLIPEVAINYSVVQNKLVKSW